MDNIALREGTKEDLPFIMNSLLKSYKESPFGKTLSNTIYYKRHHKLITKILSNSAVLVLCADDNPQLIHSYIIYEYFDDLPVIHYIFTKYAYRHLGLARILLDRVADPAKVLLYTHRTRGSDKIIEHYPKSIYDPYYPFMKEDFFYGD